MPPNSFYKVSVTLTPKPDEEIIKKQTNKKQNQLLKWSFEVWGGRNIIPILQMSKPLSRSYIFSSAQKKTPYPQGCCSLSVHSPQALVTPCLCSVSLDLQILDVL